MEDVYYYPGKFPDTASEVVGKRYCFVHIDCDLYESTKACCAFFYNHMSPFGIILFDDYGAESCKGARIAIDEFFEDKPETPIMIQTGQAFIVKRGR